MGQCPGSPHPRNPPQVSAPVPPPAPAPVSPVIVARQEKPHPVGQYAGTGASRRACPVPVAAPEAPVVQVAQAPVPLPGGYGLRAPTLKILQTPPCCPRVWRRTWSCHRTLRCRLPYLLMWPLRHRRPRPCPTGPCSVSSAGFARQAAGLCPVQQAEPGLALDAAPANVQGESAEPLDPLEGGLRGNSGRAKKRSKEAAERAARPGVAGDADGGARPCPRASFCGVSIVVA